MRFFQFMLVGASLFFMAWCPFLYPEAVAHRQALALPVRTAPLFVARFYVADTLTGKVIADFWGKTEKGALAYETRESCEARLITSEPGIMRRYDPAEAVLIPACVPLYFAT